MTQEGDIPGTVWTMVCAPMLVLCSHVLLARGVPTATPTNPQLSAHGVAVGPG